MTAPLVKHTTAALFVNKAEFSCLLSAPVLVPEAPCDPPTAAADPASALPLANEIFGDGIGDRQLSAGDKRILKNAKESDTSLVRATVCHVLSQDSPCVSVQDETCGWCSSLMSSQRPSQESRTGHVCSLSSP